MKLNLRVTIFMAVIFMIGFSSKVFANISEASGDSINILIAWNNEAAEDPPELAAKVRELNKKWGTVPSDNGFKRKELELADFDSRLKLIDKKWALKEQKAKEEAEKLGKQIRREREQKAKEEALEKRLKEIDARYEDN